MVKAICPKCGKQYDLGYNGVFSGCDECEGIQREPDGTAWYPHETEHIYRPNGTDGDKDYIVLRSQAIAS